MSRGNASGARVDLGSENGPSRKPNPSGGGGANTGRGSAGVNGRGNGLGDGGGYFLVAVRIPLLVAQEKTKDIPGGGRCSNFSCKRQKSNSNGFG